MADKETSDAPCTKNTLTSDGPQDETKKFVDSVHFSSMEPAGVHCSEKPSRSRTGSLAILESRTCSAVGKHVSHRSSHATSKQTRISTKRCSAPRDKKREGGQSCTDASTCQRGPHNDPDTLSVVRNQLETLMGLIPIVTELKSACDAYKKKAQRRGTTHYKMHHMSNLLIHFHWR